MGARAQEEPRASAQVRILNEKFGGALPADDVESAFDFFPGARSAQPYLPARGRRAPLKAHHRARAPRVLYDAGVHLRPRLGPANSLSAARSRGRRAMAECGANSLVHQQLRLPRRREPGAVLESFFGARASSHRSACARPSSSWGWPSLSRTLTPRYRGQRYVRAGQRRTASAMPPSAALTRRGIKGWWTMKSARQCSPRRSATRCGAGPGRWCW